MRCEWKWEVDGGGPEGRAELRGQGAGVLPAPGASPQGPIPPRLPTRPPPGRTLLSSTLHPTPLPTLHPTPLPTPSPPPRPTPCPPHPVPIPTPAPPPPSHPPRAHPLPQRLRVAFSYLEVERSAGRIRTYGLATWTGLRVAPGHREHLPLQQLVDLAQEVGGQSHGFRWGPPGGASLRGGPCRMCVWWCGGGGWRPLPNVRVGGWGGAGAAWPCLPPARPRACLLPACLPASRPPACLPACRQLPDAPRCCLAHDTPSSLPCSELPSSRSRRPGRPPAHHERGHVH